VRLNGSDAAALNQHAKRHYKGTRPRGTDVVYTMTSKTIDPREGTGKTMAQKAGHLLGGHHHYTSPEGMLAADPNLLDLRGPSLSLISLRFSTLNSVMVKGHAQKYAG
jgi:hypothetical protein